MVAMVTGAQPQNAELSGVADTALRPTEKQMLSHHKDN